MSIDQTEFREGPVGDARAGGGQVELSGGPFDGVHKICADEHDLPPTLRLPFSPEILRFLNGDRQIKLTEATSVVAYYLERDGSSVRYRFLTQSSVDRSQRPTVRLDASVRPR